MDALDWSWWRFLWGAGGAAAPEVVRLYKIKIGVSSGTLPAFGAGYFLISALFLILGGLVTVAWAENNALKCLWVGVSLPLIISTLASQFPSGGPKS